MPKVDPARKARTDVIRGRDADRLEASLGRLSLAGKNPALIVLIGLPGSGKSYFARQLKSRYPAVILDSDALRQVLFPNPEHTAKEHGRLFPAIHVLIKRLLRRGISVIADATNLKEGNRRPFYALAKETGAKLVIVRVRAPVSVIRERLLKRSGSGQRDKLDRSTADLAVFEAMKGDYERPRKRYFTVHTTRDAGPVLDKICATLQS
jgi:predicted kinase